MQADALSQTFAALADPTRRAILKQLTTGSTNVKELSEPFDMSGPAVCKHLRVLERAGLVRRSREAQSRPCELDPAPLKEIAAWTDAYRELWDASFDRLDAYLNQLQKPTGGRNARRRKR